MKKLSIALFTVGMMLSMLASSASAATIVNQDVPISGVIFNRCGGVAVTLSGTMHRAIHKTINDNTAHISIHINYADVQGTAANGTKYVLNVAALAEVNISLTNGSPGLPSGEGTFVNHVNLISQGSAPNLDLRLMFRITVNANGDVTVMMYEISANCQG